MFSLNNKFIRGEIATTLTIVGVAVMAIGALVGARLSQQPQSIRSQAAECVLSDNPSLEQGSSADTVTCVIPASATSTTLVCAVIDPSRSSGDQLIYQQNPTDWGGSWTGTTARVPLTSFNGRAMESGKTYRVVVYDWTNTSSCVKEANVDSSGIGTNPQPTSAPQNTPTPVYTNPNPSQCLSQFNGTCKSSCSIYETNKGANLCGSTGQSCCTLSPTLTPTPTQGYTNPNPSQCLSQFNGTCKSSCSIYETSKGAGLCGSTNQACCTLNPTATPTPVYTNPNPSQCVSEFGGTCKSSCSFYEKNEGTGSLCGSANQTNLRCCTLNTTATPTPTIIQNCPFTNYQTCSANCDCEQVSGKTSCYRCKTTITVIPTPTIIDRTSRPTSTSSQKWTTANYLIQVNYLNCSNERLQYMDMNVQEGRLGGVHLFYKSVESGLIRLLTYNNDLSYLNKTTNTTNVIVFDCGENQ